MNEKIRLFERQSGIDVYGLGKDRDKWEHKLEQFAELIVQECIKQLEASFHADPYTGETYDNIVNSVLTGQIDNIKEHFGVE